MDLYAEPARPPSPLLLLLEGRALWELGSMALALPLLRKAPRGDGHPVLVLPGFLAGDSTTVPMRLFLRSLGYEAQPWELGRNLGLRTDLKQRLILRLRRLSRREGRKVSLIGWSLGGVLARELARWAPDAVRMVITLGSPFANNRKANHAWRVFELLNDVRIEELDAEATGWSQKPLPVPTTSIFSRTDGISSWRCSLLREGPTSENIEVLEGSHLGMGFNPLALYAIADRLAQPEGAFQRFSREGVRRFLYPEPLRPSRFPLQWSDLAVRETAPVAPERPREARLPRVPFERLPTPG